MMGAAIGVGVVGAGVAVMTVDVGIFKQSFKMKFIDNLPNKFDQVLLIASN